VDTGLLKVVFRDLPLPMHPDAVIAAEAAHCAAEQEKFVQMHDLLMGTTTRGFGMETLLGYGRDARVDQPQFKSCLESHKFRTEVQTAAADMAQYISGTPTFVLARTSKDELSGDVLTGALPFAIFESAIKRRLGSSQPLMNADER
jgi:protein-disulfide isomerase